MLLPQSRIQTPLHKALVVASIALGLVCFGTLVYVVEHLSGSPSPGPERDKQEDDIREATFRYQFLHYASSRQEPAVIYFLSIHYAGQDPSGELMKRFADHTPTVKKFSQSAESDEGYVIDDQTRAKGVIFRVYGIRWMTRSRVEVSGGYSRGYLNASGNTYYLEKKDGKWIVVRAEGRWIS
jgi:hypothetical protein